MDVFVVVDSEGEKDRVYDLVAEVALRHGVHIAPVVRTEDEFERTMFTHFTGEVLRSGRAQSDNLDVAEEMLSEARFAFENDRSVRTVEDRAFYCMYYAVLELLIRGVSVGLVVRTGQCPRRRIKVNYA